MIWWDHPRLFSFVVFLMKKTEPMSSYSGLPSNLHPHDGFVIAVFDWKNVIDMNHWGFEIHSYWIINYLAQVYSFLEWLLLFDLFFHPLYLFGNISYQKKLCDLLLFYSSFFCSSYRSMRSIRRPVLGWVSDHKITKLPWIHSILAYLFTIRLKVWPTAFLFMQPGF